MDDKKNSIKTQNRVKILYTEKVRYSSKIELNTTTANELTYKEYN